MIYKLFFFPAVGIIGHEKIFNIEIMIQKMVFQHMSLKFFNIY